VHKDILADFLRDTVKDKYGEDAEDEDETDYSSEDSDAELVTPQVDAAILKMIGRIRSGDTQLYDSEGNLFEGVSSHGSKRQPACPHMLGSGVEYTLILEGVAAVMFQMRNRNLYRFSRK
jgi:hypothetical protein